MTFRLTCPVCGKRDVYEFTFGGEERGPAPEPAMSGSSGLPADGLPAAEGHFRWTQFKLIPPEPREEWWYHGAGCGVWFKTTRNPATNREVRE